MVFAYNFMMSQVSVETEDGFFRKEMTKETGIMLDGENFKMMKREITDVIPGVVQLPGTHLIKGYFMPYYLSI